MDTTEIKPSQTPKKLDANEVVEIMKRAVKRELNPFFNEQWDLEILNL